VRTPPDSPHAAEVVLDAGAAGIVVPRLDSAPEAAAILARTSYAHGRGLARAVSAWSWGANAGDAYAADSEILRVAQIETLEALRQVDAIAALPLVDALFLGATDLALDARRRGETLEDGVAEARVAAAAAAAGKASGALLASPADLSRWHAGGYSLLACSADVRVVLDASAQIAAEADRVRGRGPSSAV
jgi:4-hydroxy-2-oxoheptanedioate aldolase